MMDREQFDRWLEREARRMGAKVQRGKVEWSTPSDPDKFPPMLYFRDYGSYVAYAQERQAPPVSPEIEAFCASVARQWRKP